MLFVYVGSDREAARAKMSRDMVQKKSGVVTRITDANSLADLRAVLQGGGMFGEKRVLVFEEVCTNPELCPIFLDAFEYLSSSSEDVYVYEEKPRAELRKNMEKHAARVEKYEAIKKERDTSIFVLAEALRCKDKKKLWIGYLREIAKGSAPEAVNGVLFWAAKDLMAKAGADAEKRARAQKLLALLAELPHEARRRGEDLEYALERFTLSVS